MEQNNMIQMENVVRMQLEYAKKMKMEQIQIRNARWMQSEHARWMESEHARWIEIENVKREQIELAKKMDMERMKIENARWIEREHTRRMEMENVERAQIELAKKMDMERMKIENARWIERERTRRMEMKNVERAQIELTKVKEMQHERMKMKLQRWRYILRKVPNHMSMDTVKVGLTPLKLKKNLLIKHFREFGEKYASKGLEVEKIYLKGGKKKKFYAFVTFKNIEDVDACFQLDEDDDEQHCLTNHEIQGILVPIKRASNKIKNKIKSKQHL